MLAEACAKNEALDSNPETCRRKYKETVPVGVVTQKRIVFLDGVETQQHASALRLSEDISIPPEQVLGLLTKLQETASTFYKYVRTTLQSLALTSFAWFTIRVSICIC